MDTSAVQTLVPAAGLGTVLVVLIGYLIKLIADNYTRASDADARAAAAHERAELAQMQVDEERAKRRDAEHKAAAAEARVAAQDVMLQWYAREREHLRRYLPVESSPGVMPDPPELEANHE